MTHTSSTVALIDYGAGNLRSVANALLAAGLPEKRLIITTNPDDILQAERIVLPGVGAFAACMHALQAIPGMTDALSEAVLKKSRPFLGICVGMQLLAEQGEEHGIHKGLGWIKGSVKALKPNDPRCKVPHMGWNQITLTADTHPLLKAGEAYFLHSYAFFPTDTQDLLAKTDHGGAVTAAVGHDNIIGVQFHPEKSQGYGLRFLSRFLEWHP
ncbi:MAG: imidazole glycerol phosphate synthase subunit HisH [Zymomonas mobilis subsp. pomaceae]|uniref:Imidazole glycerol phosphate synthase subunit HisH n=1 Tax=Zymomonas mobilis subsp. pomaceae (strain ATCC 29192 / DSM 22645 / JCM 10191 / CCUG 17912 / NBRC 13757 / NCIMB 11200 / NRRL B-4491 / Barker I) TaxID=579138 RepID=F8EW73_ZYMMT|nr:imidazole glycerol phosphate synthase subunit HisH [Zymomonas mobilis]AEI38483.1 imidazole glycerol phosphate synthase, glutamine amidotransferase subunit [Zymomonas mobilis subsp. pomaceae ATCC 29192]MDX5948172.1 imidazole glycerol phosphate synthase subunit HisH [Zymomonas mobilis subsp. pomaceae]GEB89888.1 imidazole glycerol phosphate synthase subunit HisH [Zymomonas mobilis subsp. pomaceae]